MKWEITNQVDKRKLQGVLEGYLKYNKSMYCKDAYAVDGANTVMAGC